MSNKKTYLFLAEGFEEIEALAVVDLLRRASIDVDMVSISDSLEVIGGHNIKVLADKSFKDIEDFSCDMLILPGGGLGVENLKKFEPLNKLLVDYNNRNKFIAAICAAPSILGKLNILRGRRVSCYPGFEEQLTGAETTFDAVSFDSNIITSRGPGTAILFALKIIDVLAGHQVSEKIKDEIIF